MVVVVVGGIYWTSLFPISNTRVGAARRYFSKEVKVVPSGETICHAFHEVRTFAMGKNSASKQVDFYGQNMVIEIEYSVFDLKKAFHGDIDLFMDVFIKTVEGAVSDLSSRKERRGYIRTHDDDLAEVALKKIIPVAEAFGIEIMSTSMST
jgi:hypothetical protein